MENRWTQIRKLFREAIELAPAQWEDFLKAHCPDVEMQEKILLMLAAYDVDDTFLEHPAADVGPAAQGRTTTTQLVGSHVGPYLIKRAIARGGMGVVFEALDTKLDKVVALKMMSPTLVQDPSFRQRFEQEAKTLARLEDPHFVRVNALIDDGPNTFIVMEYVDGLTLSEHIKKRGPLAEKDAVAVGLQLLQALSKAHHQGVIHRDLKPSNIMLTKNYEGRLLVKVLDFGIAKNILPDAGHTRTIGAIGTLFYMSPEQARGLKSIDHRTDLYSLAVTLYEALSGNMPFDAEMDEYTIRRQIVEGHVIPINKRMPGIAPALAEVLTRALATDPDARFADAEAMRQALLNALNEIRGVPGKPEAAAALPLVEKKRPAFVLTTITMLAVFAIAGFFIYTQFFSVEPAPLFTPQLTSSGDSLNINSTVSPSIADAGKPDTDVEETPRETPDSPEKEKSQPPAEEEPLLTSTAVLSTQIPVTPAESSAQLPLPDTQLDSGQDVNLQDNERTQNPSAPLLAGILSVRVDPPGNIYINNTLQKDPIVVVDTLITGKHLVHVENGALGKWTCEVNVDAGLKKNVDVFMGKTTPITVSAEDIDTGVPLPNQSVYLDGASTRYTTPETFNVSTGLHKISLKMDGYEQVETVIQYGTGCFQKVGDMINVDSESIRGSTNRPLIVLRMKKTR